MKKILIITNAPFLKAGNQSLRRTIEGLLSKNFYLELWLIGSIANSENISNFSNIKINAFSFPYYFKKIIEVIKKFLKLIRDNILIIFNKILKKK